MQRELTQEQVNELREQYRNKIEVNEALNRLYSNPDFKLVFLKTYLEEEPSRVVSLLSEPSHNFGQSKEDNRTNAYEILIGISRFGQFLRSVNFTAGHAQKALDDLLEVEKKFYSGNTEDEVITNT